MRPAKTESQRLFRLFAFALASAHCMAWQHYINKRYATDACTSVRLNRFGVDCQTVRIRISCWLHARAHGACLLLPGVVPAGRTTREQLQRLFLAERRVIRNYSVYPACTLVE